MTVAAPSDGFEDLVRELAPQVLGALVRRYRDFPSAEDAVQEALLAAATQWPVEGVPENPRGWLIQVGARRITDHLRSEAARRRREAEAACQAGTPALPLVSDVDTEFAGDDTLALLFLCCHPSLNPGSAVALTLRAVGGLTTQEIARAFLVPETTMAQRISRAKQIIKSSGVRFTLPAREEQAARLGIVLHVLYLIFNEGYASSGGAHLQRLDLSREAIRLTRAAHELLPDDPEMAALLALMLLTDARSPARTGVGGELIPLAQQNRQLWSHARITEGVALLTAALAKGSVGPYQLQAAIAAVHDEAARAEDTDWLQILALYELLRRMSDNPMVTLNHAVALAMVRGPAAGLARLAELDRDPRLAGHYRLCAVRAHLLERAGDRAGALAQYRQAAAGTASLPERDYLTLQAARLNQAHL